MRILSLIIMSVLSFLLNRQLDSPHGSDFKISCKTCHSPRGWQLDTAIYSFDHNNTKMPLIGRHTEVNCRQCHPTLVFNEAKNQCNECHTDIHQATTGSDCSRCHTQSSWLVNNINEIHQFSRFPLLGAHRTADCSDCHISESLARFDVQGINCIDCHRNIFTATTNPNHIQAGFSENCSDCHPVNSFEWSGAGFSHNFFALVQGHSIPKCSDCHTTGKYSDTNPECISCHQPDYLATTNPNHVASNFPVTCNYCHTLSPGWKPANFDHTSFPLTLGHSTPACTDCHTSGNFSDTPTDCYACHQSDYTNTSNPNHNSLGFATNCTECHTTNPGWTPASYKQHDTQSFPIYSGKHKGVWSLCTECHTNSSSYSVFSCIGCHEHNKTNMDEIHQEESGYSYNSTSCFSCHPRGNAE